MDARAIRRAVLKKLRRTPLMPLVRELYVTLSSGQRALRRAEKDDAKVLATQIGDWFKTSLRPIADKAPRVLFMGMGRVRFIAQESVLRKAFQAAGMSAVILLPKDWFVVQTYRSMGENQFLYLDDFLGAQSATRWVCPETLSSLDELTSLSFDGVRCGKYAISTLMRQTRSGSFDLKDQGTRRAIENAINDSIEFAQAARDLLRTSNPAVVVLSDRGYSPSGELFDVCMKAGVSVVTWNAAHKNNTLMLKRYSDSNANVHPSSLSTVSWELLKGMPWTPSHWKRLEDELISCYVNQEWYSEVGTQFNTASVARNDLIHRLGLDPSKKTAIIFPHIFWDATFFWGKDLFENYEQWFIESVKAACSNDRINWIIKVHPANTVKNSRDGIAGEYSEIRAIREQIGALPSHIKLIDAKTDINTLSLYGLADVCATVRGTVGIEAACFGIPVVTAGTGRYDRLGFTLDAGSREEYLSRLSQAESLPRLTAHETDLARRYAYGVFLQRPVTLKAIDMSYRKSADAELHVRFRVNSSQELAQCEDIRGIANWISAAKEDYLDIPDGMHSDPTQYSLTR